MSNGWQTKADVLRDLSEVNGRRTGAEELDRHVVAGERPPPYHHEVPDKDEMSYFSGGNRATAAGDGAGPDLNGISTMLKMVNDMDETVSDYETMTLYRNRVTDEIRISKLNPCAGEYVPAVTTARAPRYSPSKSNNKHRTRSNGIKVNDNVASPNSIKSGNETKQNGLPTFNNMFKSKNEKGDKINVTANKKTTNVTEPERRPKEVTPVPQIDKQDLPKADKIKEVQEKLKSTILASSTENTLKTKRQKNVAIATLLKLGTIPIEPVKLMKPDYFEKPPTNEEKVENQASTSSSVTNGNYIDHDSISKVRSWFSSMECPKPKPQLQEKLVLKDSITFKKKTSSSVTSLNTTTTSKESPKETKSFKPSAYADDLLKRYETNVQHQEPLIEDLGTRLERQLKERDEVIKQKMLARQNAGLS